MTKREGRLGRCYERAGKAMLYDQGHVGAVLVHGRIQGNGNPRIDHAWLEYPDYEAGPWAWEPSTGQDMPLGAFYALFAARASSRYTLKEVREKVLTTGHWGPWDAPATGALVLEDGEHPDDPRERQFIERAAKIAYDNEEGDADD